MSKRQYAPDLTKIRKNLKNKCQFISEDIEKPQDIIEIQDLKPEILIKRIEELVKDVNNQIDNKTLPSFSIPFRRRENIIYNQSNQMFLGKKQKSLFFNDKYNELNKILRVAQIVKDLLQKGNYATKREVFYEDVKLFEDQKFSDNAIEDLAILLGTFRSNLNIVASCKGTCIGRLQIRDKHDIIDCQKLGSWGWTITSMLHDIEVLESDAEFILVLEKDAAMIRFSEARFWDTIPSILISAKGYPDYATRFFIKKLIAKLKIPAFGFADSDPYGLSFLMTYAYGSVQSSYETSKLGINNFYWLGVMPKDIQQYNVPEDSLIPMLKTDITRSEYLLKELPVKNHNFLKSQVELMQKMKVKCEIQALSCFNSDFLQKYIIDKIETGDLKKF